MITYVADAIARGVQLVHHCDIEHLLFNKDGAVGAEGRVHATKKGSRPNTVPPGRLRIAAKLIIMAGGAIATPALLQRSRHPDPHGRMGRGLVVHPSLPVIGIMDQVLENYRGIPGTVCSDAFADSHHVYFECLFGHPAYASVVIPGSGAEHFEIFRKYSQLAGFGIMLVDEVDDANRVEWSAADGKARIHYQLTDADKDRLRFAASRAVEVMFAAGAKRVLLASDEPIGPLQAPRFSRPEEARHCSALRFEPHRTSLSSAHAQASMKMSVDPARGMTNSRGESHFVRNLIVCDASSFPGSCGANPMLAIMTMARYQGRRIAGELARYAM